MSDFQYCTPLDVRLALSSIEEFDKGNTGTELTDFQIRDQIDEAMSRVDSYLIPRYRIDPVVTTQDPATGEGPAAPVTVAPRPVRGFTRTVAAYLVNLTYRRSKDISDEDPIRLRFAMVTETLESIRDGKSILPLPPGVSDDDPDGDAAIFNLYEGKLFGLDDFGLAPYQRHNIYVPRSAW